MSALAVRRVVGTVPVHLDLKIKREKRGQKIDFKGYIDKEMNACSSLFCFIRRKLTTDLFFVNNDF